MAVVQDLSAVIRVEPRHVECLKDGRYMEELNRQCAIEAGAKIETSHHHKFPQGGEGVSSIAVVSESHLALRAWPEYCAIDFNAHLCGKTNPRKALDYLAQQFPGCVIEIKASFSYAINLRG